MVKCKTGDAEVSGSIPGRCNSSLFIFLFFLFFCFFFFLSFFDKKTERKGMHMLLDNMSSLKMQCL